MSVVCLLSTDTTAFAYTVTTQEPAYNVYSQYSLAPYSEFTYKSTDGGFYIPGLNSAVSYNNEFKCYSATDSMVPQGMCTVGHYTLITAYDYDGVSKSVIYVLDNNKSLVKTLILPDSYHVGGITYDIQNQAILISKSSKRCVAVISLSDFYKYMNYSGAFVKINYTVSESAADKKIGSASGVAYSNGLVYLTSFGEGSSSVAYCYAPVFDPVNRTYTLFYRYQFSLPNYTQGITISDYKGKTRLFASVSYGRSEAKRVYCSYLYTYTFDRNNGYKALDNVLTCPPMLQQTVVSGGKLYCLFESASNGYKKENKNPVDIVWALRLNAVCDEKAGSVINISTNNVPGGKSVSITTNVPGGTVYYSSSLPYISYRSISWGSRYKGAYLKKSTGMVYAVVVADGKIVASDAAYITVSKASSPSKLKVTAYSKKAVNLKWNSASNASGYYVYRSTKKDKDFKKIGEVKGSKTAYKDRKVKPNKKYYYKVIAYRKGYTNSRYTSVVSVKTKK